MTDSHITPPSHATELERELATVQSELNELDSLERTSAEEGGDIDPREIKAFTNSELAEFFPHGIGPTGVPHSSDYATAVALRRNLIAEARDAGFSDHRIASALGIDHEILPTLN